MDLELKNKVVLITGGSTGIGLAVADEFLKEGSRVIICGRSEEKLQEAIKELSAKHGQDRVTGKACDVAKLSDIEQLMDFVSKKFGVVNILINNAGVGSEEKSLTAPDEKWYYYWDLHVMAAVRLSRMCAPLMQKAGTEGVIINTTSVCATQPLYYEPIYNVTKAALTMFSKCLADEFIKLNIRVLAIAPGLILTPDWYKTANILSKQEGITTQQYFDRIAQKMTPLGRFGTTEEVARFYTFSASPKASYLLGTSLHIDAGAQQGVI